MWFSKTLIYEIPILSVSITQLKWKKKTWRIFPPQTFHSRRSLPHYSCPLRNTRPDTVVFQLVFVSCIPYFYENKIDAVKRTFCGVYDEKDECLRQNRLIAARVYSFYPEPYGEPYRSKTYNIWVPCPKFTSKSVLIEALSNLKKYYNLSHFTDMESIVPTVYVKNILY